MFHNQRSPFYTFLSSFIRMEINLLYLTRKRVTIAALTLETPLNISLH